MEQEQTHLNFNYIHWASSQLAQEYQYKIERILMKYPEESAERRAEIDKVKIPTKKQIFALAQEVKTFVEIKE